MNPKDHIKEKLWIDNSFPDAEEALGIVLLLQSAKELNHISFSRDIAILQDRIASKEIEKLLTEKDYGNN